MQLKGEKERESEREKEREKGVGFNYTASWFMFFRSNAVKYCTFCYNYIN